MGRNLQGYACARSPNQEYASFKKGNIFNVHLQVNKFKFACFFLRFDMFISNKNSYSKEIVDLHGNTHLCQCLSILVSFVMFWYMPFLALC